MTPAESGLEMAKLTRPDTDTSLLNTNMSAAWAAKSTHRDKITNSSTLKCKYTITYHIYGSVSAGREKWPFNVLFFFKK